MASGRVTEKEQKKESGGRVGQSLIGILVFSVRSVFGEEFIGIGSQQLLFIDFWFIFVASYIELPFMILPIFNVLDDMDNNLINASYDLGATKWETFRHVIFPLSMNGVRSGVQSVFIPSLSLFMLTRLIGGNRVITLGTAIEQNFLTNDNYGMGSTIGVILILTMFITMWVTKERRER